MSFARAARKSPWVQHMIGEKVSWLEPNYSKTHGFTAESVRSYVFRQFVLQTVAITFNVFFCDCVDALFYFRWLCVCALKREGFAGVNGLRAMI